MFITLSLTFLVVPINSTSSTSPPMPSTSPRALRPVKSVGRFRLFSSSDKSPKSASLKSTISSPVPSPPARPQPEGYKNLPPLPTPPTFTTSSQPTSTAKSPPSTPKKQIRKAAPSPCPSPNKGPRPNGDVFVVPTSRVRSPQTIYHHPPRSNSRPQPSRQSSLAEKVENAPGVAQVVGAMDRMADSFGGVSWIVSNAN